MLVPDPSNPRKHLLTIRSIITGTFFLGSIFGVGIGYGFQRTIDTNKPACDLITSQYNLINLDMTPTEARSILGPGNEVRKSKSITVIAWYVPKDQIITAIFQGNQLIEKELSGSGCLHKTTASQ